VPATCSQRIDDAVARLPILDVDLFA